MKGFIKISNKIFDYNLSPKALYVYAFLCSKSNVFGGITITYETLSASCKISPKTVRTALDELQLKQLVSKNNRYNSRGYLANRYIVNHLKIKKGWFPVERAIFDTSIQTTDFMIFCYIRKCMCGKTREAFPSLSAIHTATGISRGRVVQAVAYLRKYTFLNRIKRHYKKTKAYRHNRYMEFTCNVSRKGKKNVRVTARLNTHQKTRTNSFINNIILTLLPTHVKSFVSSRGSTQFTQQFIDPQIIYN